MLYGLVALMLYQTYYYCRYLCAVPRLRRRQPKQNEFHSNEHVNGLAADGQLDLFGARVPGVSVIVCARNEGLNLRPYLQTLLEQDYPLYEVIVVNDSSEDDTQHVIEEYMVRYAHMRTTFVPVQARVRSSKKLALTLGVKCSHFEYLLLTDADCRPESKHWISSMMEGMSEDRPETEIVLGYGAYFQNKERVNALIQYDTIFNALQYLGMAICRHPYMGVGRNLLYRKQTFLDHGGFAGLLNELSGDDDLLINRIATPSNTQVVVSLQSFTWSVPKHSLREWLQQKRRHISVSPLYRSATKIRLSLEPLSRAAFYALVILCCVFGSMHTICLAVAMFCARLLMQLIVMNMGSHALLGPKWGLSVLWYDIVLPLISLWMLLTRKNNKNQHW